MPKKEASASEKVKMKKTFIYTIMLKIIATPYNKYADSLQLKSEPKFTTKTIITYANRYTLKNHYNSGSSKCTY